MTMLTTTLAERPSLAADQSDIDLVGPLEACEMLVVNEAELLALVNNDQLPAYRLDGYIRFRTCDVMALIQASL